MKRITVLAACLFILSGMALAASNQPKSQFAVPEGVDLAKYPIVSNPVSFNDRTMADLGLHPMVLSEPFTAFNHHRNIDRFVLETLPAGTLVYADSDGRPIYKGDCKNRLGTATCPKCVAAPFLVSDRDAYQWSVGGGGEPQRSISDAFKRFALLAFLLGILLVALMFVCLLVAIARLINDRDMEEHNRRAVANGLTPPFIRCAPAAAVAPTPAPAPASTPQPAPAPQTRRYVNFFSDEREQKITSSGYRDIRMSQEGDRTTITFRP